MAKQKQLKLFDRAFVPMFDGRTIRQARGDIRADDNARLKRQLDRVLDCMGDGQWWTLRELCGAVQGSETGVSARIRDLRKEQFGGYVVDSRRREGCNGLWEYRLVVDPREYE